MAGGRSGPGRDFGWLWAAYGASALGTGLAFGAFPLLAITVLHEGAAEVAALASLGAAVGAAVAVPLGPWVEARRKRSVMVAMDLARCAALLTVPVAYALGRLGFGQLLLVAVVVAAADITFGAAAGACLKALVRPADLVVAQARLESTSWTATVVGPPLGGALIALLGPVATVMADAVSYLLSAAGIRAMGGAEGHPARDDPSGTPGRPGVPGAAGADRMAGVGGTAGVGRTAAASGAAGTPRTPRTPRAPGTPQTPRPPETPQPPERPSSRLGPLAQGWRLILAHPVLRPLFLHTVLVNGLILATSPLLAVLMLGPLGFAPWQYGLAFALPCVGGLVGARLAPGLVDRFGRHRVLLVSGTLRVCWPVGLVFVHPGVTGLLLVIAVELALITCIGVFNPVFAAHRLALTETGRVARTLTAWSVTGKATVAALTALWGLLAGFVGPRAAIGLAGACLLATPLLLPRREGASDMRADTEIDTCK
ncbi:MFS transporter [Streptomyces sp. NBC_00094]|uniref:MFS transporter n=1 Tax=Streptomyces sp. NBC_00094 TaxID=2903620 RepID=UPI00225B8BE5|nr:MFS transporter [Streptomyces sp. NBC_00094]MCX5388681.1 MFS transporter [Streptomyces sp. NBC_00094]